jgi:methionine-R-sulfoxide reductase
LKENEQKVKWYQNYSPEVLKNATEKNIVLFFHADWCSTCKSFEKKVLTETIPDDILILKVNYDTELELRKEYNIVTQTSFVLIDNKWNLRKRWIWARWIEKIISKIWEVEKTNNTSKVYTKEELKLRLTPLQYKVTQEWWTEPAFNNKYWDNNREGIYVDIVDRTALFSSTDKFKSGTGWPSFTKPIDENFVQEKEDFGIFVKRTEIKTDSSHLGHVFEDGPSDKWWLRYCINSAALDFIPKSELKGSVYEKYLELFE